VSKTPFLTKRYLGLVLSGAKNQKTALAILESYPKENKTFLLDIFESMGAEEDRSSDEALLETIDEYKGNVAKLAVNVPQSLPPCIECTRKTCPMPTHCSVPSVKWMRELSKKHTKNQNSSDGKEFTPYTQRPVELWLKYSVNPELKSRQTPDIDETFGGTKAPLSARMHFLRRHLKVPLTEVHPKLTVQILASRFGLSQRLSESYRHLERGAHARAEILDLFSTELGLFIYDRDIRKLSQNLAAFDAFICALTAWIADQGDFERKPERFPDPNGWVLYPKL
jgi:hypothetical protein